MQMSGYLFGDKQGTSLPVRCSGSKSKLLLTCLSIPHLELERNFRLWDILNWFQDWLGFKHAQDHSRSPLRGWEMRTSLAVENLNFCLGIGDYEEPNDFFYYSQVGLKNYLLSLMSVKKKLI